MMATVLAMLIVYFRHQNRDWLSQLDTPSESNLRHLHAMARGRGWTICYLWALLTVTVIFYGLRHPSAETEPASITQAENSGTVYAGQALPLSGIKREIEVDKVKTYYEDAYVSYYYLYRCKAAGPEDNVTLYRALVQSLESLAAIDSAPQIMSAARGSFEVIYSRANCEEETLAPVKARFEAFMQSIRTAQ